MPVLERAHHIQPFIQTETRQRIQAIQEMLREESPEVSKMCVPDTISNRVCPDMIPNAGTPAAHQLQRAIEERYCK